MKTIIFVALVALVAMAALAFVVLPMTLTGQIQIPHH